MVADGAAAAAPPPAEDPRLSPDPIVRRIVELGEGARANPREAIYAINRMLEEIPVQDRKIIYYDMAIRIVEPAIEDARARVAAVVEVVVPPPPAGDGVAPPAAVVDAVVPPPHF